MWEKDEAGSAVRGSPHRDEPSARCHAPSRPPPSLAPAVSPSAFAFRRTRSGWMNEGGRCCAAPSTRSALFSSAALGSPFHLGAALSSALLTWGGFSSFTRGERKMGGAELVGTEGWKDVEGDDGEACGGGGGGGGGEDEGCCFLARKRCLASSLASSLTRSGWSCASAMTMAEGQDGARREGGGGPACAATDDTAASILSCSGGPW